MDTSTKSSTTRTTSLPEAIERFEYFTRGGAAYNVETLFTDLTRQAVLIDERHGAVDVLVEEDEQPTFKLHVMEQDFVIGAIQAALDKEANSIILGVNAADTEVFATITPDELGMVLLTPDAVPNAFNLETRRIGPGFIEELTLMVLDHIHASRFPASLVHRF
ncbi:hypothetical protein [Exiguobacterium sp.]|uniref:hypothetical protein n=1 Tax=Exiguobacterium sp. TaxID=44751 RepID=UPI00263A53EE|nr:hypothetical protein [Exiguobacterium sp.]MCC5893790.1 hypothetical protein [Exiguobacterium sp.]